MQKSLINRMLLLALLIMFVLLGGTKPASAAALEQIPMVVISPATYAGEVGDTVLVSIWVEDVLALYGADVQISFPPGGLEVQDANPSLPGVQVSVRSDFLQPELLLHREADNPAGTIWYAASQMYPTEPVSGSGILFEFQMKILQDGIFPIQFSSTQLAATGGESILHVSQGAIFTTLELQSLYLPVIIR